MTYRLFQQANIFRNGTRLGAERFRNQVSNLEEVTGEWRKFYGDDLHCLNSSLNINQVIEYRR
jgi:hypothetical protein